MVILFFVKEVKKIEGALFSEKSMDLESSPFYKTLEVSSSYIGLLMLRSLYGLICYAFVPFLG